MSIKHNYLIITVATLFLFGCSGNSTSAQNSPETQTAEAAQETSNQLIEKKEDAVMQLTGTIRYQDFEGGFYGFVAQNGKKYTLSRLANEYRRDGLVIQITAEPLHGMATTTQFGELLTVHTVKVIDDSKVNNGGNNNVM
ncbi:hypothetical protein [Glaciecola sp. SC05]|uniref:hypothetical protein n=1 Tax=Glaciecola sp. SC05 TaxID=1987355 RepID=UPI003528327C